MGGGEEGETKRCEGLILNISEFHDLVYLEIYVYIYFTKINATLQFPLTTSKAAEKLVFLVHALFGTYCDCRDVFKMSCHAEMCT